MATKISIVSLFVASVATLLGVHSARSSEGSHGVVAEPIDAGPDRQGLTAVEPGDARADRVRCPAAVSTRDSVVLIRAASGIGTGFVFGDQRTIATAWHVVAGASAPIAVDRQGRSHRLRLIAIDRRRDLAILEMPEPLVAATPLQVQTPEVGEWAFAVGHGGGNDDVETAYPELFRWSVLGGLVAAVSVDFLLMDIGAASGASGSPIVGCDGGLYGVVSWAQTGATYTWGGLAEHLHALWTTRRSTLDEPIRGDAKVELELGLRVDSSTDQIGASIGLRWLVGSWWGFRLESSISTNALVGDVFSEGRVTVLRVPFHVVGQWAKVFHSRDALEFGLGIGWRSESVTAAQVVAGGLGSRSSGDDDLLSTVSLRYVYGRVYLGAELDVSVLGTPEVQPWIVVGILPGPL